MKGLALIITLYSIIHHWQAHEKDLSLTNNYVTQGEISSQSTCIYVWQKLIHHFRKQITYMFHLEDKCLKQLSFLLILGGQVELNPGPRAETLYPCQICKDAVKWGQEGIACDNCDLWYHRECMTMTSDSYHRFADNSSLIWLCKVCNTPNHCSILYQSINSDDNQFSSF